MKRGETVPMRVYRYGERLRFPAKLRAPRNFRNPGAFDYRGYLAGNGIVVLASAKTATVEVLPGFVGTRIAGGGIVFIAASCGRFMCSGARRTRP